MFERNTYIVLDLPETIASKIHQIRTNQDDTYRASLPDEITVAGSSGVGPISSTQNPKQLFDIIDSIASTTKPIKASFKRAIKFDGTDVVVLVMDDEHPFRALHEVIIKSDIEFTKSDFEFQPHCTLRSRSPLESCNEKDLLGLKIKESFILDTISIYSMPPPMTLLHRAKLSG